MNPEQAMHYLELAREARSQLLEPGSGTWMQRLEEEYGYALEATNVDNS